MAHRVDALKIGTVEVLTAARVLQNVTFNATLMNAGSLAYGRLPTGSGSWDVGSGNTLTLPQNLAVGSTAAGKTISLLSTGGKSLSISGVDTSIAVGGNPLTIKEEAVQRLYMSGGVFIFGSGTAAGGATAGGARFTGNVRFDAAMLIRSSMVGTSAGFVFRNEANTATILTVQDDGTLGVGTSSNPGFNSIFPARIQLGQGSITGNGGSYSDTRIWHNLYYDGGAYRRITTEASSLLMFDRGAMLYYVAAGGSAGGNAALANPFQVTAGGLSVFGDPFLQSILAGDARVTIGGPNYSIASARGNLIVHAVGGAGIEDYGGQIVFGGEVGASQAYSFAGISGRKTPGMSYAGYLVLSVSTDNSGNHTAGLIVYNTLQVRLPNLAGSGTRQVYALSDGTLYAP